MKWILNTHRGKAFSKPSFQLRMGLKKGRNKADTEELKKATQYVQKYTGDVG